MSTIAIVMMIVALLAVWGGLGLALLNLKRHPEEQDDAAAEVSSPSAEHSTGGLPGTSGQGRHRSDS